MKCKRGGRKPEVVDRKCCMCDNKCVKQHIPFCSTLCRARYLHFIMDEEPQPDKLSNSKGIQTITLDQIKHLRATGHYWEAEELLQAWRKNVKENTAQLGREIRNQDRQILRIGGICTQCRNDFALKGRSICGNCSKLRKIYRKEESAKRYERRLQHAKDTKMD